MTVQELLTRCREFQKAGKPTAGLKACDDLLAAGAKGHLRAVALRYKAIFLLGSNAGWANVAVTCLKEALEISRRWPADQAHILTLLIAAYSGFGSVDYSRDCATRFLVLAEDNADVAHYIPRMWYNLGCCYDTAGRFEEAAEAYERSLATMDLATEGITAAWPEHNLVQVYLGLGRVSDALAMLERSRLDLDMERYSCYFLDQEAQCLLALGRSDEALLACRKALQHPDCDELVKAEATLTLARIMRALDEIQAFDELVEKATELAIRLPHPRLLHRIEGAVSSSHR